MKKAFCILLFLFTYYLAAMYRYSSLMVLCGMEFLIFLLSLILPRLFLRGLYVSFPKKTEFVQAGRPFSCMVRAKYTGRFLTGRFTVGLGAGYMGDAEEAVLEMPGECGCGETDFPFCMRLSECGLLRIRIKGVQVYDSFSLFSVHKVMMEEMLAVVYPFEYVLQIEMLSGRTDGSVCAEECMMDCRGNACDEIVQIREYRDGDSVRHIHWNMSARTDKLWYREYGAQTGQAVYLMLDPEGFYDAETEKASAFYTLLYALIQGLLRQASQVCLYWFDAHLMRWEMRRVHDGAQCREIFFCLYQLRARETALIEQDKTLIETFPAGAQIFRLDMNLSWFLNQTVIYQFSGRNLEQEILNKVFLV